MKLSILLFTLCLGCESVGTGSESLENAMLGVLPNYFEITVAPAHSLGSDAWGGETIDEEAVYFFTLGWRIMEPETPDPRPLLKEMLAELQAPEVAPQTHGHQDNVEKDVRDGLEEVRRYSLQDLGVILGAVLSFISMVVFAVHRWTDLFRSKSED